MYSEYNSPKHSYKTRYETVTIKMTKHNTYGTERPKITLPLTLYFITLPRFTKENNYINPINNRKITKTNLSSDYNQHARTVT